MATGRERQWDILLDGTDWGYKVVQQDGVPVWSTEPVPKISGDALQIAEEQRSYDSLHLGFGWSQVGIPNAYWWAEGIDCRDARDVKMAPLVTSFTSLAAGTAFFKQGSSLYLIDGRYIQRVSMSGDTNDTCEAPVSPATATGKDFGSGVVVTAGISFDGSTIVYIGNAANGWLFTGSTWTELTGSSIQGSYGGRFWSDNANAYVTFRTYLVSSDPAIAWLAQGSTVDSASWSSAYDVGDDTQSITGAVGAAKQAWVAKKDGLYYIDRYGRSVEVLGSVPVDDNNGVNLDVDMAGRIWYPGRNFLRYDPNSGTVDDVMPGQGLPLSSCPIYGRVTCHVQYKAWHYAWVYNGTDSYLMCGREREQGEPGIGPLIWHGALAKVASAEAKAMFVWTATSPPRLYWAAGSNVYWMRLEETMTYAASGTLYLPYDNWGVAGTQWYHAGLVVDNTGCNTATYLDIYAKLDGAASWSLINSVKSAGYAFVPLPSGTWKFSECALRIDFTNGGATTATPRIQAISSRATRRPPVRDLIQTMLHCSERAIGHYGITTRKSGAEQLSHLRTLLGQGPVQLKDWWTGSERRTDVMVVSVKEHLVEEKEWQEAASAASITMVAQSSETVQTQAESAGRYGTAVYGTGAYG